MIKMFYLLILFIRHLQTQGVLTKKEGQSLELSRNWIHRED